MSKKLLSEAVMRRFAKLANLPAVNEGTYGGNKGDESRSHRDYVEEEQKYGGNKGDESRSRRDYMKEDAFEDEAEAGLDAAEGELDAEEVAGLEDEAGADPVGGDLGGREAMAMDVISAVADALNIEVDIDAGEEAAELEDDAVMDDAEGAELDADALEDEEAAIMEALRGINYIPGRKEIVNEVAKRVARRLLQAQKAEKQMKAALGRKK